MEKSDYIIFGLWMILAVVNFIVAFWAPMLFPKIVELAFGGFNLLIILTWTIGTIRARKEYKKQQMKKEE